MRTCIRCKQSKVESEFNWRNIKKGYLQSVCISCQQAQGRERYDNHTQAVKKINRAAREKAIENARLFIHEFLSQSKCADCGETDISVLTFHHIKAKKMNISDMVVQGYALDSIK